MTVPPLTLDTLDWSELVGLARGRLAALSQQRWTLHGPVDPGVTLLELFASQLEQRLFLLDQEPDALVRAVLGLLGVDPPRAARAANTAIALDLEDTPATAMLPAVTLARAADRADDLVVATVHGVPVVAGLAMTDLLSPPARDDLDARGSLGGGRAAPRLDLVEFTLTHGVRSEPLPSSVSLYLEVAAVAAPAKLDPFGGMELTRFGWPATIDGEHRIEVLDIDGRRIRPLLAPTELEWWADIDANPRELDVIDGTGGLRHSGVVTLSLPPSVASEWRAGRRLSVRVSAKCPPTFSYMPVVTQVATNAVVARHAVPGSLDADELAQIVRGWAPVPDLVLAIPGAEGRLIDTPGTIRLDLVESDGEVHSWTAVDELLFTGAGDRVFTIDRLAGALRFGDGRNGRIPRLDDPPRMTLSFLLGGGDITAPANQRWHLELETTTHEPVHVTGRSCRPLSGGSASETVAEARRRASQDLDLVRRTVRERDHQVLVEGTPGVDLVKAEVVTGLDIRNPCSASPDTVTVVCVPRAPRGNALRGRRREAAPRLDPGAHDAIRQRLEGARLVGSFTRVCSPRYRKVRVEVDVDGHTADADALGQRVRRELVEFLDPVEGGASGTGWPLGGAIRPADLVVCAQRALGPDGRHWRVTVSVTLEGRSTTACEEAHLGRIELPEVSDGDVVVRFRSQP